MTQYGWTGEGIVPDHLTIVFWIDGAHGQMKLITIEEKLDKERKLKINLGKFCCTYQSEQSADLGPYFKWMKEDFNTMEISHQNMNPLVKIVKDKKQW